MKTEDTITKDTTQVYLYKISNLFPDEKIGIYHYYSDVELNSGDKVMCPNGFIGTVIELIKKSNKNDLDNYKSVQVISEECYREKVKLIKDANALKRGVIAIINEWYDEVPNM